MTITVSCPSCATSFPVDPDKVPEGGVNARCSSCGDVFFVEKPDQFDVPEAAEPTPDEVSPAVAEAEPEPADEPWEAVEPRDEEAEERAGWGGFETEAEETPAEVEAPDRVEVEAPDRAEADAEDEDWVIEREPELETGEGMDIPPMETIESAQRTAPAETPETEARPPEEEEHAEPVVTGGFEEEPEEGPPEAAGAGSVPGLATSPAPEAPPEPEAPPAEEEAGEAEGAAPETLETPEAAPQGFQFGRRDPHDKARRLARVLVSDMIMYNPERHQRALAGGSLQSDFDEEIKKSWQEYIEQVGPEIANDTTYFTDALNDILAKGDHIFHGRPGE